MVTGCRCRKLPVLHSKRFVPYQICASLTGHRQKKSRCTCSCTQCQVLTARRATMSHAEVFKLLTALGDRRNPDQEQRYLQCVLRSLSSHDGAHAHALTLKTDAAVRGLSAQALQLEREFEPNVGRGRLQAAHGARHVWHACRGWPQRGAGAALPGAVRPSATCRQFERTHSGPARTHLPARTFSCE